MALTRPIVLVYQQYATINIAPSSPDMNCVLVGPCFHIQDYPADKTDIDVGDFVKSPYTTANAPCDAVDGHSSGRPTNNADFLALTNPPNHTAGGALDAASVDVIFDNAYLEITKGINLRGNDPVAGPGNLIVDMYQVSCAAATFLTTIPNTGGVPNAAFRIVISNTAGANAVVRNITKIVSNTVLQVDSTFKAADIALLNVTDNRYRIEHTLVDQHIDPAYFTIVGNNITIKTGATGILLAYNSTTYPVNFANMYIGYRELRTDLTDVHTLSTSADIAGTIGRNDERNPLAAAATVAFMNTMTPIQVFGVNADTAAGHTDARDKMAARSDIYAIVPLQDNMSIGTWLTVITMWQAHAVAYADPTKSKFRMILGSWGELPTSKSACPPSLVGNTLLDPGGAALVDVFVDPSIGTEFVQKGVDISHLLDVSHMNGGVNGQTVPVHTTIFDFTYTSPYMLYGAMGEKRIRTACEFGTPPGNNLSGIVVDYAVRNPILLTEGGTPVCTVAAVTWNVPGGHPNCFLTKAGAVRPFDGVAVGDVVKMAGSVSHNFGLLVTAIDAANADYIDISTKEAVADASNPDVEIYRPLAAASTGVVSATKTITKAGAFVGVVPGDIAFVFMTNHAVPVNTNVGMWIIQSCTSDAITVFTNGAYVLDNLAAAATCCVAVFSGVATNGAAAITTRKRLTRLQDDTASFMTTVTAGMSIEIPYPADTLPTHFDTPTTSWLIDTVVSNEILDADLGDLEELAPKLFVAGYTADDCPYRISIALDKTAQVVELNTIPTSLKSNRLVLAWPNECTVTDLKNNLTNVVARHHGQYLATTIGAMIAGLPPQQGFTFIGVAGISALFNSNFYFNDDQIDDLSEGGWYVFMQDSGTSAPYSAHEVTTDTSAYELGELMYVKDFDYISIFYKNILTSFLGRYNITAETLNNLRAAFNSGTDFLLRRSLPKIGAPIISSTITKLEQLLSEVDRVEIYAVVDIPKVLNKIGLHLIA